MKGLLLLSALLFIPGHTGIDTPIEKPTGNTTDSQSVTNDSTATLKDITTQASSGLQSTTTNPVTISTTKTTPTASATPTQKNSIFHLFYKQECHPLFMVPGILIIICTVFLISILMLLYKVCQLSRRLKTLSNNDPINMSESWTGTAESNKNKPETEAKESTMLMADLSQTQDETNNGTVKEDGEKVKEDEQTREEKEVGDTANSEEASAAPVTAAEEEATDSQPDKAVEAASSEGKEEPDVEKK